jgi:hypothetical protein
MKIHVSPNGDDTAEGTADAPVRTLPRAQALVRNLPRSGDVDVVLADGTYALDRPLAFTEADGGNGRQITWRAADGAKPVISGGTEITGWRASEAGNGIWEADVSKGMESRQLWVNDRLASVASIELPRTPVTFDETGITVGDNALPELGALQGTRVEVENTGYFTDRISPVERIDGRRLVMRQPAWGNNNWGYDTFARPHAPQYARLFLRNDLALLRSPGQWYLDPDAGRLYYMPPHDVDMRTAKVVLPRLSHLLSISGSYLQPVRDLTFEGLRFSHTSWLGPSTADGYANQQSGAFLAGPLDLRPADALETCSWGCPEFETLRNEWNQIPAAVQVSAAERITFRRNVFAHLGQIGLGIGNNDDAHASGVGLGAVAVEVSENVFTDLAGGAIMAGGVSRDAHHPRQSQMANRNLTIRNNRIHKVSQDYRDNSAILSTYVDRCLILHNEITGAPYDGIDIGWGWGINDPGGNPTYRIPQRRYYDWHANLVYGEPTLHRDVVVAFNRLHKIKQHFEDGGAIYNLSASPGTVIAENYIYDIPGRIGLYLDEGSRHVTMQNNVVEGAGIWLKANTIDSFHPQRITINNRATGNWHDGGEIEGRWITYLDNLIEDDCPVENGAWPEEARRIMDAAGIEPTANLPDYPLAPLS